MSFNCITKTDDIFRKLNELSNETKRWLLGKYFTEEKYTTNLTKSIPIYDGESICHRKFNFTTDGTRCFWCNTFSLLSNDGEIYPDIPITIECGSYRGQKLVIEKYDKGNVPFGTYEPDDITLTSHLLNIEKTIVKQRMINRSCDASHSIAISSLINASEYPFKSRVLGGWICDKVNLIKLLPIPGNISDISFTPDMARDIFFQLFFIAGTDSLSHGSPASRHLFVASIPSKFSVGKKNIKMLYTLMIDPDRYSSFSVDYNGRKLYFVGKHSVDSISEPNWNIGFIMGCDAPGRTKLSKSPCLKKYLTSRILTITPTIEIMNYIRLTGINVFPQIYFFLYMTIALLNRSFYESINSNGILNLIKKVFIEDDFNSYISIIHSNQGKILTEDEILELVINSGVRIRLDLFEVLNMDVLALFT